MHSLPFKLTLTAIIFAGTLLFQVWPFFSRPWVFAPWVRCCFWIIGVVGISWTVLNLVLLLHSSSLSWRSYRVLDDYQAVLSGVAIGLLALFFLSGEAVAGCKRRRELKRTRGTPKA
jgi:hypothetical protein